MIGIKNITIAAILIVIVTMSMLASAGSGDGSGSEIVPDSTKVPTITLNINPVKSPTNIPTQIISGSGMASGCKGSGGISDLRVTVNGLPANIDASTMTFSRSISLSEGKNTITVTATIGTLCSITKTTSIILETTPQPATSSISVTTNLSGATFSLTGTSSYSGSGTSWSTANAPAGTYTITYGAVTGYTTPPSETKTLTAGGSISFSGTYVPKDTNGTAVSGLVAEWHFDGSAQDTSGSGNHGTIKGATFVQGISGQALGFDGVDDMVVVPHSSSLSLEKYTVEAWVKTREFGTHNVILRKRYEPSWMDNYGLAISPNGTVNAGSYSPDIWTWFGTGSVRQISAGEWYHIAATYDRTAFKIYINGILENSVNIQYSPYQNNQQLVIGRACDGDPCMFRPSAPSFNGIIDEVRIYNRALSASEIQAEYNALINPPTTVTPDNALYAEKRIVVVNESVLVPLNIKNATNIGNMDILLTYDQNVVKATKVQKGSLTGNTMFDSNVQAAGEIRISFASTQGIKGDGSIAYIEFQAIGSGGSTSPVTLVEAFANEAGTMDKLNAALSNGEVRISEIPILKGDVNGDGVVSAADALMALKMSVGWIPVTAAADVNGDGRVTSVDSVLILQAATGKITL